MTAVAFRKAKNLAAHLHVDTWTGRAFAVSMATVWLHFVDASLIQPQANAAAVERLMQVVAALTVPPAAVLWFNRAGRWARGTVAFFGGLVLGSVGIVIHGLEVVRNGFAPAEVTGLLLIPAGVVLIIIGALSSMRFVPHWRYRPLVALGVVASLLYIGFPLFAAVYATHVPRRDVAEGNMGAPYEDVAFQTGDGETIRGWYVPSRNGAAVMLLHGSGGARTRVLAHARMLVAHGYGVLAFDVRGHGESSGPTNAFGWDAHPDVAAAAAYMEAREDVEPGRVGALGLSMGAEIVLDAASRGSGLTVVVAEGAGVRSVNELRSRDLNVGRAMELPVNYLNNAMVVVLSRGKMPPVALAEQVGRITVPVLLISGDIPVERDLNRIWFRAINAPKELWEVDAGHTAGLSTYPAEYDARVTAFLDAALLDSSAGGRQ